MAKKLSVIIPTHNRIDKLEDTIEGLRRQTILSNDYEVVVVDDGSTSPVKLEHKYRNPECTVVRLEGMERSAARNAGAASATGRILVFIDDDISVGSGFLLSHLRAHEEWPGVIAVGSVLLPDNFLVTPYGRFRQKLEQNGIPHQRGLQATRNLCTAANMSISRDIFQSLGGFDRDLKSGEDQDMALRHTAHGGRIAYIPEAEAFHNDNAVDFKSYCRRSEWGAMNMVAFVSRHPHWPDNVERERVNGPLKWGREAFSVSAAKMAKVVLGCKPITAFLFFTVRWLERSAPNSSILYRLYCLLLGIHILRGYRAGCRHAAKGDPRKAIPNERLAVG